MKKIAVLLLVCMGCALTASADELEKVQNRRAFNISYVSDKLSIGDISNLSDAWGEAGAVINEENDGFKNNWGISLSQVRTFRLHKRPIGRFLSFGLDVSFFDLTYSNYTVYPSLLGAYEGYDYPSYGNDIDPGYSMPLASMECDIHKMEYAFQVGPTVILTPGRKLMIAAYARYSPAFSCIFNSDNFSGNYATMFVGGASVCYKKFGVGIEARVGSAKYKNFNGELDFSGNRLKTSGFRAYVQFRW